MEKVDKINALKIAVDMVKEFGRGGYEATTPDVILNKLYDKIIELNEDALKSN